MRKVLLSILAVVIAAAVAIWLYFDTVSAWAIEHGEVKAAWVQAISAVLGISVTIALWRVDKNLKSRDEDDERKKDSDQRRELDYRAALSMAPILADLVESLDRISGVLAFAAHVPRPRDDLLSGVRLLLFSELGSACRACRAGSPMLEATAVHVGSISDRIASLIKDGIRPHAVIGSSLVVIDWEFVSRATQLLEILGEQAKLLRDDCNTIIKNGPRAGVSEQTDNAPATTAGAG